MKFLGRFLLIVVLLIPLGAALRFALRTAGWATQTEVIAQRRPQPPQRLSPVPKAAAAPPVPRSVPAQLSEFPKFTSDRALYDPAVLRTLSFEFARDDWDDQLTTRYEMGDDDLVAQLTVDGQTYSDVGVRLRGVSSLQGIPGGYKRPLNVSLDFRHPQQRLLGFRTLNLLNGFHDPSFVRAVIYLDILRKYVPAPRANFVRVVVNGELWGIYVNVEQVNSDLAQHWFGSGKSVRWKVVGDMRRPSDLVYVGDVPADYHDLYQLKGNVPPAVAHRAWGDLVRLCRVLEQTPVDQLSDALQGLLDVEGTLRLLALENIFVSNDGYWTPTGDYNLVQDAQGTFHLIPHDVNETWLSPTRRNLRGGGRPTDWPMTTGELEPLFGADNLRKPLLARLLAVPELRLRYLTFTREVVEQELDWNRLAPVIRTYQELIRADVVSDQRKLFTTAEFVSGVETDVEQYGRGGPETIISLRNFVEQRRAYLLDELSALLGPPNRP